MPSAFCKASGELEVVDHVEHAWHRLESVRSKVLSTNIAWRPRNGKAWRGRMVREQQLIKIRYMYKIRVAAQIDGGREGAPAQSALFKRQPRA